MRAHLAAVDAVDLAHALFDERVTGFRQHRLTTARLDHLDGVPGQARIMHHLAARLAAQQHRGQQAHDVIALDETALFVEQETAVEVAIPGYAEVRLVGLDGLDGGRAVLLQHRVRDAVRKCAVRLVVHLDELERQVRLELIDDQAGAAVTGVDDDLERLQCRLVDIGQQVCDVGLRGVGRDARALARRAGKLPGFGKLADVLKSVVAADGLGLLAHEFHAVVIGRIVAGGDHDAAVVAAVEGRKIHALRAAHTDVVDIDATVGQTAAHRIGEFGARQADVAADHDALGIQELCVAARHAVGHIVVQLVGNAPTQVIGFETRDRFQVLVPLRP